MNQISKETQKLIDKEIRVKKLKSPSSEIIQIIAAELHLYEARVKYERPCYERPRITHRRVAGHWYKQAKAYRKELALRAKLRANGYKPMTINLIIHRISNGHVGFSYEQKLERAFIEAALNGDTVKEAQEAVIQYVKVNFK
jgi:hypothetical protein